MKYRILTALALATAACGGKGDAAKTDSLQRDLAMAPADSTAAMNDRPAASPAPTSPAPRRTTPAPRPVTSAPLTLGAGTEFGTTAVDSITSRSNRAGETMHARVSSDVKDPQGRTIIPAGATVTLRIDELAPAENDNDHTGKLKLTPTAVDFDGRSYGITGTVDSVHYSIVGRGVTAGDAAKVGAGAVAGGIAGRVIGGNRRATVVGAVVGAAAGAAVASKTNDRDVVIRPTNYIRIKLTGGFTR